MNITYKGYTPVGGFNEQTQELEYFIFGVDYDFYIAGDTEIEAAHEFIGLVEDYLLYCSCEGVQPEKPISMFVN